MTCRCDEVGPPLKTCPRCKVEMAPIGRSVGLEAATGYCGCEQHLFASNDRSEWASFLLATHRSSLWPGERWGDSLPCLGDVFVAKPRKEGDE